MPVLTPELGLEGAELDDDTADYLVAMLGPSLSILDGLFNGSTGHNHDGPHQGGQIDAASVAGPFDLDDWVRTTSAAQSPWPTTGVGIELYWNSAGNAGVLQSYDRQAGNYEATEVRGSTVSLVNAAGDKLTLNADASLTVPGGINATNLTVSGSITATGGITAAGDVKSRYFITDDGSNGILSAGHGDLYLRGGIVRLDQPGGMYVNGGVQSGSWIAAGANLSGTPGDITANRGANTGYVWLGNSTHHVGFDGTNYVMPNGNLYVAGDIAATGTNAITLSNKTISDPRLTNQVTLGGASFTLPAVGSSAGLWRFLKAWGQNMPINLTNGTLILFTVQYGSGQYVLRNGDSLSCYCDGSNWWVL